MAYIVEDREKGLIFLCNDWHILDVLEQAEEMEVKLTNKQAEKVLRLMCKTFDANIGINWGVVEECIRTVKGA